MRRYLLQKSASSGESEIVEIETSGILEASRIVGWNLSEGVKAKVFKNNSYQLPTIEDWLPELGREIKEEFMEEDPDLKAGRK